MVHLKPIRVNSSYFPDDYDEDKEKQSYEDQDNHLRYFVPISQLPEFFVELLARWSKKMTDLVRDYFEYTQTPIFCDTVTISVNGNIVEFCCDHGDYKI